MATWDNADGLLVRFGVTRAEVAIDGSTLADEKTLVVQITGATTIDLADINEDRPHLPTGAIITDAFLVADTAWTGTGTLTIGLGDSAGVAIDIDGIDAAIDVDAVLAAQYDVVACDGVLVDKTEAIGERAWVYTTESGTVAGVATLHLKYIAG
jgi:hypothetical protein